MLAIIILTSWKNLALLHGSSFHARKIIHKKMEIYEKSNDGIADILL
jgi:hypothetical protein